MRKTGLKISKWCLITAQIKRTKVLNSTIDSFLNISQLIYLFIGRKGLSTGGGFTVSLLDHHLLSSPRWRCRKARRRLGKGGCRSQGWLGTDVASGRHRWTDGSRARALRGASSVHPIVCSGSLEHHWHPRKEYRSFLCYLRLRKHCPEFYRCSMQCHRCILHNRARPMWFFASAA